MQQINRISSVESIKINKAFHWDDLRYFLALYRHRKLISAGKSLNVDHTTVSRRVRELESALNTTLFEKTDLGFEVTTSGKNLIGYAETIESTLLGIEEKVCDENLGIKGLVRIGTPEDFGDHFLAPKIPTLLKKYNQLEVELVASQAGTSLPRRDFDIMITHDRPQSGRLVVKKLTDYKIGIYASKSYLKNHNPIVSENDFSHHELIGGSNYLSEIDFFGKNNVNKFRKKLLKNCSFMAQYKAVVQGHGVCVMPEYIADEDENLIRILPENFNFLSEYWLVVPEDIRYLSRIKKVSEFITEAVSEEQFL